LAFPASTSRAIGFAIAGFFELAFLFKENANRTPPFSFFSLIGLEMILFLNGILVVGAGAAGAGSSSLSLIAMPCS